MSQKPGFMVYNETLNVMRKLDNEQRGRMFLAMGDYHEFGVIPSFDDDAILDIIWTMIQPILDRDAKSYQEKCEKNKENAKKRYVKKEPDGIQTHPNASDGIQTHPNASEAVRTVPTTTTIPATISTEQQHEHEHERIVKGNNSGYTPSVCSTPDRNEFDRYVMTKGFSSYIAKEMWNNLLTDGLLDTEWKNHVDAYIARMNSEGAVNNAR